MFKTSCWSRIENRPHHFAATVRNSFLPESDVTAAPVRVTVVEFSKAVTDPVGPAAVVGGRLAETQAQFFLPALLPHNVLTSVFALQMALPAFLPQFLFLPLQYTSFRTLREAGIGRERMHLAGGTSSTRSSQVVSHPGAIQAQCRLTLVLNG